MEDKYSTIEQVAAHYQVSISTVRAWIRQDMIPSLKVGGLYRLKFSEIDAAFKQRAISQVPPVQQQVTVVVSPADAVVLNPDQDI
jgi:excisionase family DNA binding protein